MAFSTVPIDTGTGETFSAYLALLDQPNGVALPRATGKVGALGYCLGGTLAFMLAIQSGVDAAVSYYGVAIQASLDAFASLKCQVLLHVASDDHLCPPQAQAAIAEGAAGAEKATILLHPGVGHAFATRGGSGFDAVAAARADAATAAFFERKVG